MGSETNPEIAKLISSWGNVASGALFDSTCQLFHPNDIEGLIGYRIECGTAVVFGDPVCPPDQVLELMAAFKRHLAKNNINKIAFVIISEKFASALKADGGSLIQFGDEFIVNPQNDPTKGSIAETLRRKLHHAAREGVTVSEYTREDPFLKNEIEQVGRAWLKKRKGAQIYISHVNLFASSIGRRWFYAKRGSEIIGVALLLKRESEKGWFLNRLMITPDASHGTSETLAIAVIETLREEGCHFLSLGTAREETLGRMENIGKISSFFIRVIYKISRAIFNFSGLKVFLEKFQPKKEPLYLLFQPHISFREIKALIRALNASWTH